MQGQIDAYTVLRGVLHRDVRATVHRSDCAVLRRSGGRHVTRTAGEADGILNACGLCLRQYRSSTGTFRLEVK